MSVVLSKLKKKRKRSIVSDLFLIIIIIIIILSIVHRVEEKNDGWPTLELPVISHPVNLV